MCSMKFLVLLFVCLFALSRAAETATAVSSKLEKSVQKNLRGSLDGEMKKVKKGSVNHEKPAKVVPKEDMAILSSNNAERKLEAVDLSSNTDDNEDDQYYYANDNSPGTYYA